MAATTAFQPGGYPGRLYGSFAGKEEQIIVIDELIGRKYPRETRRGRSRQRIRVTDDVDLQAPKKRKRLELDRQELEQELAETQADLISAQLADNDSVNRTKKIAKLTNAVAALAARSAALEADLIRVREEEVLMMLLSMALEM